MVHSAVTYYVSQATAASPSAIEIGGGAAMVCEMNAWITKKIVEGLDSCQLQSVTALECIPGHHPPSQFNF